MKYILSGDAKEVEKVMRENRIRVARGLIKFEPVPAEVAADAKTSTTDDKTPVSTDDKAPKAIDVKKPNSTDGKKTSKK